MVKIRPFKGIRPKQALSEAVASPPYDVLSTKEVEEIVARQPQSFLRIIRPEVNHNGNAGDVDLYQSAKEQFESYQSQGILEQDQEAMFYLYRLTWQGQSQIGLISSITVEEYDQDIIKRHELTRPDKEEDRANHVDTVNANTGPLFLTYRNHADMDNLVNDKVTTAADVDFTAEDDVRHEIWVLDTTHNETIKHIFTTIDALYVADGHHRMAAASRVRKRRIEKHGPGTGNEGYNYALAVLFPDNQLRVLDYNRVIRTLNGKSSDEILAQLAETFTVNTVSTNSEAKPSNSKQFGMYLDDQWYSLTFKDSVSIPNDPVKSLDVSLLQDLVLEPIFGIENPRTDKNIDFVGGIRGLEELEKRCNDDAKVAFAFYPTSVEELINVADAQLLMPPKSTWFEPKLRSGLVVHPLGE